jgi:hypothetical protein
MTANETISYAAAPASSAQRTAARTAFAAGLLSFLLLVVLHAFKSDLDPATHVVSEYALGEYGWMMALCFLSLAIGCASLFVALRSEVRSLGGKIGLAFLAAAAVGLTMAAMFPMDPITIKPEDATTSGRMHGVSGMIGIPSLVIAAVLLSVALRRHPWWTRVRFPLIALAHLSWISVTLMFAFLAILIREGTGGLGGLMGWANRLLMLAYCGWVMVAAWPMAHIGGARDALHREGGRAT